MGEPACSLLLVESCRAPTNESVRVVPALEKRARRIIVCVQTEEWLGITGLDRSSAFLM